MKKYLIVIICLSISSSWFTNIAAQQAKNTMGLLTQNEWVFPLNDNKGKNLGAIVCLSLIHI